MTLTGQDFSAINRALETIYATRSPDEFIVCTMRILPTLMNSDMAAYNEVDYAARRMTTLIDSADAQVHWHKVQVLFETMMNQNPLIAYSARSRGKPKKISDFITSEEWRDTGIYQAVYRQIGGEYQIAVPLLLDDDAIVAFAFNRKHRDFTEREQALLTLLQPHLTQAFENGRQRAQIHTRAKRGEQALEALGAGWIDVDPTFRIVQATAHARDNLSRFFRQPYAQHDRLPPAVENWMSGPAGLQGEKPAPPPLIIKSDAGRLIVRLISISPSGNICLSTERFVDAASPKPLESMGLTRRQSEVLFWICQGKSNAEIAVILKISVRTVTFHVSRILECLSVSNRTEAANLAASHLTSAH